MNGLKEILSSTPAVVLGGCVFPDVNCLNIHYIKRRMCGKSDKKNYSNYFQPIVGGHEGSKYDVFV